jgi:hypothetical protein
MAKPVLPPSDTPPLSPELINLFKQVEQIPRNHVHFVRMEVWSASTAISLKRIADRLDQLVEIHERSGDALRGIERASSYLR